MSLSILHTKLYKFLIKLADSLWQWQMIFKINLKNSKKDNFRIWRIIFFKLCDVSVALQIPSSDTRENISIRELSETFSLSALGEICRFSCVSDGWYLKTIFKENHSLNVIVYSNFKFWVNQNIIKNNLILFLRNDKFQKTKKSSIIIVCLVLSVKEWGSFLRRLYKHARVNVSIVQ